MPLMKNVHMPISKNILVPLGLPAAVSATDTAIQKKNSQLRNHSIDDFK